MEWKLNGQYTRKYLLSTGQSFMVHASNAGLLIYGFVHNAPMQSSEAYALKR